MLTQAVLVGVGGFAGALARLVVGQLVTARLGMLLPYGTLLVNLSGCFLLGLVLGALQAASAPHPAFRPLIATGFLGAYTTFSTFSAETAILLEEGSLLLATVYLVASVGGGLLATFGGLLLGRAAS